MFKSVENWNWEFLIPKKFHNKATIKYTFKEKRNSEGLLSVFVFDYHTWKNLVEFKIPRMTIETLGLFHQYFDEIEKTKTNMSDFSFNDWRNLKEEKKKNFLQKNWEYNDEWLLLNFTEEDFDREFNEEFKFFDLESHYIKDLIFEWKRLIPIFEKSSTLKQIEDEFLEIRKRIEDLNWDVSMEEVSIDSTLSDIYWTTTMEGQEETRWEIKELLEKWDWSLISLEANNVKKCFETISLELEDFFPLTIEKTIKIHSILTNWLDELKLDWLDYNSWNIREWFEVDMWIFKWWNNVNYWYETKFFPPKFPKPYLNELFKMVNEWEMNLAKLSIFHLIFYWLHPFQNWNKRTTRLLESVLIQKFYDKNHLCFWMWYAFRKDRWNFFKYMRRILWWEITLMREWVWYYAKTFLNMWKESLENAQILALWKMEDFLPSWRKKYYDKIDEMFFRFYKKNKKWFKKEDLVIYFKEEWIFKNANQSVTQRLEKHLKDWFILESWIAYFKKYTLTSKLKKWIGKVE